MSTIIDLNTATTVNFNDESLYAIVFGTNAGNTTANVDSYGSANISKQTPLNSITDAVRDLLIDVQFSNVGNVSMAYVGTWANVGLLQVSPAAWRVNGIRSVAQYNEAFANVRYTDLNGAQVTSPEYSYITTVNDQSGNTRTWNTSVNVLVQPTISITGNLVYNEDTITPLTQVSIAVDPGSSTVFRMFANTIPTYGSMTDGVVTGNSVYIDGNVSSLNSQIAAGDIKFWPASDFVSNVGNAININLATANTSVGTANVNIQIGSQDTEYTLTTNYNYTEDAGVRMVYAVTDADTRALGYTITFNQATGNTGQFAVNNVLQGIGNAAVITGTKANVNVANVTFLTYPDTIGNVGLTYSQVKSLNTGNVTQAANIAISAVCTNSHSQYTFATSGTYPEDNFLVIGDVGNLISDIDPRATSYSISLSQSTGNVGKWYVNDALYSNSNVTLNLSNTKANINSANIKFLPAVDSTANLTFVYNQVKVNNAFGNITQAANVTGVYTCITNNEINNMIDRSYTSNTVNSIFSASTPSLDDGIDQGQIYTITLNSSLGNFGNSVANALTGNTYSFTGNTNQVNSQFSSMVFVPNYGPASTGTFTYTQARDGVSQVNRTLNLSGTNGAAPSATYTFTSSGTWTPSENEYLFGNAEVLVVAGGGGGAVSITDTLSQPNGGSGGAGGGVNKRNYSRTGTYSLTSSAVGISVGGGGFRGSNSASPNFRWGPGGRGSNSSFGSLSATGGAGGLTPTGAGGSTSSPSGSFSGGAYRSETAGTGFDGGGGGAGGGANGTAASSTLPGDGGQGYYWTATGQYYAGGGAGAGRLFPLPPNPVPNYKFGTKGTGSYGQGGSGGLAYSAVEPPVAYSAEAGASGVVIIKFV